MVCSGIPLAFVAAGSTLTIRFSPNCQPWMLDLKDYSGHFGRYVLQNLPKNLCPILILVPTSTVLWTLQHGLLQLGSPPFLSSLHSTGP